MCRRSPRARARLVSRLLSALAFVAMLLVAPSAFAQAVITVVNEVSLPRLDNKSNVIQKRPQNLTPEGVNFQDCLDDQQIQFTLQVAGIEQNGQIQQWASNTGGDCKDTTQRTGIAPNCWQLGGNIPLQLNTTVNIPVRKIMSGAPPNSAATAPQHQGQDVCGQIDLTTVTVHFLYFSPGNAATASSDKTVNVLIDTVGPQPPGGLTVLPGNTRITVQWASISGGDGDGGATGGLTALTGVRIYCDPLAATGTPVTTTTPPVCQDVLVEAGASASDAGDAGDAATGSGGSTTVRVCDDGGTSTAASDCASPNFVNADGTPVFPSADFAAKYECGSFNGNSGTTVVATSVAGQPLVNGQRYAVGVAATDAYGNAGALSSVVCETPAPTTDFWDEYKKAGGKAGNGCAAASEDTPVGSMCVIGGAAAVLLSSARRRRESNREVRRSRRPTPRRGDEERASR